MTATPLSHPRASRGPFAAFSWGAFSVFRGLRFIARTKRAWAPAAVPGAVLVVLALAFATLSLRVVAPAALAGLPEPTTGVGSFGVGALRFVLSAAFVLLGVLVAAWLAPALSGPALERIILLRERDLGAPERPATSFLTELWCGLRAQVVGLVVGAPVLGLLWMTTLFAPPLAVVTVPAKLVTVSLLVAWGLLDYPLSLRGIALGDRVALLRSGSLVVIGFGAAITVLFAIPFGAIVLLPAGVAGAAEIAVELEGRGRRQVP